MTFYDETKAYDVRFDDITRKDVEAAIAAEEVSPRQYRALLSPIAADYLEPMAQRAHSLTRQYFGSTILLYTPLYLANYCINQCSYCGFNVTNDIRRSKLDFEQVEREAKAIATSGFCHVIILTGESEQDTPTEYIADCVRIIKKHISNVTAEVYPHDLEGYKQLVSAGADGLTLYQETYNPTQYDTLHISGPKKDYDNRLAAPERACAAGFRNVNIGALLGLYDCRSEGYYTGMHARYLQRKYPSTNISVSFPRMRQAAGCYDVPSPVGDREMVQLMLALRIFLPQAGITISTRESASFRDSIMPLGVTKMSADSVTVVGGHSSDGDSEEQFAIADNRPTAEIYDTIKQKGLQPIFKYDY